MYVKLSWRPEVDKKLSHNGCTAVNFDQPDHGSEIPKSKATYSRAANTKTNGENIYRKLKLER